MHVSCTDLWTNFGHLCAPNRQIFFTGEMLHTSSVPFFPLPCPNLFTVAVLHHPRAVLAQVWLSHRTPMSFAKFVETEQTLVDNPSIRRLLQVKPGGEVSAVTEGHLRRAKAMLDSFDLVLVGELNEESHFALRSVLGKNELSVLTELPVPKGSRTRVKAEPLTMEKNLVHDLALYEHARGLLRDQIKTYAGLDKHVSTERLLEGENYLAHGTVANCTGSFGHICRAF
mmetsp:Transcript_10387/g.31743  ORF Transcript_10387/g.31743 Transcript_10387/m.31743 type:complete len:228 (+) Transcript_10387:347-1030(+)